MNQTANSIQKIPRSRVILLCFVICSGFIVWWVSLSSVVEESKAKDPVLCLAAYARRVDSRKGVDSGEIVKIIDLPDFSQWPDVTHAQMLPLELAHLWEEATVFSPDILTPGYESTNLYIGVRLIDNKPICYQFVFCDYPIIGSYTSIRFTGGEE